MHTKWWLQAAGFWNRLVRLPHDALHRRVAIADCHGAIHLRVHNWAWSLRKGLHKLGYTLSLRDDGLDEVHMFQVRELLEAKDFRDVRDVDPCPRTCPTQGAVACTHVRWFARPSWVPKTVRQPAFLTVSARSMRNFLRFRAGCHGLPSDVGKWTHVPRHQRLCSQCSTICDARHLIFECTALDALKVEYACLFSEPNPTMLSFMWQNDMHAVIRFIDIALGMSVLREAELPPNHPDVAGSV